jgi:hypothetical protein
METTTVYSEDHMKFIYSVGKMQSSYDVKAGGTHCNHRILRRSGYLTEFSSLSQIWVTITLIFSVLQTESYGHTKADG